MSILEFIMSKPRAVRELYTDMQKYARHGRVGKPYLKHGFLHVPRVPVPHVIQSELLVKYDDATDHFDCYYLADNGAVFSALEHVHSHRLVYGKYVRTAVRLGMRYLRY